MNVNRRSFLAALAAPLIVRPTLEDIERLTWRRRMFPGYSPVDMRVMHAYIQRAVEVLANAWDQQMLRTYQQLRGYQESM